jgi:hypothetical protein
MVNSTGEAALGLRFGFVSRQDFKSDLPFTNHSPCKGPSPLSSRAKPRDLQFRGPFLEMFFDQAQWRDLRFLFS